MAKQPPNDQGECPKGYHKALNGECVEDITPPSPDSSDSDQTESEN